MCPSALPVKNFWPTSNKKNPTSYSHYCLLPFFILAAPQGTYSHIRTCNSYIDPQYKTFHNGSKIVRCQHSFCTIHFYYSSFSCASDVCENKQIVWHSFHSHTSQYWNYFNFIIYNGNVSVSVCFHWQKLDNHTTRMHANREWWAKKVGFLNVKAVITIVRCYIEKNLLNAACYLLSISLALWSLS